MNSFRRVHRKLSITENHRSQSAVSVQQLFCSRRKCLIHPVARFALFGPAKADPLDFKLLADERVQIYAFGNHVATEY